MTTEQRVSQASQWMAFFGALLTLIGLYGAGRMLHISTRGVPYPSRGIFPDTILLPQNSTVTLRESECDPYPQVYYDYSPDGKQTSRPATQEELDVQQQQTLRCINGFNEDRAKQKQYDKNQSAFLIFVGAGLLLSRRFL
ncbi:MAG: hypothetical protein HYW33_04245 [Candidatus Blackburnbacteria bacterium]|nr:hypothetical protein [Candidatus Blackburnbacteria bacterium]